MDFLGLTSITASLHLLLPTTVLTFCIHSAARWLISFFSASHACHEGKEKTWCQAQTEGICFFSVLSPRYRHATFTGSILISTLCS